MMKMICAALAVTFSASAVLGQGCAPGQDIEAALSSGYGEVMAGSGVSGSATSWIALYVNAETGTWTIVQYTPDGVGCIRAMGNSWNRLAYPPQGEDG